MNPATICSGFRRNGIHPFNPDAITCSISVENPDASLQQVSNKENLGGNSMGSSKEAVTEKSSEKSMSASKESASENATNSWLSPEKLALFQRRYEEGYDLPDEEYVDWLLQYHPDSALDHTTTFMESSSSDHASQMGSSSDHASQIGSGSDHVSQMGSSSDHASVLGSSSDQTSLMGSSSDHTSLMGTSRDHMSVMGSSSDHTSLMGSSSDHVSQMGSSSHVTLSIYSIGAPASAPGGFYDPANLIIILTFVICKKDSG